MVGVQAVPANFPFVLHVHCPSTSTIRIGPCGTHERKGEQFQSTEHEYRTVEVAGFIPSLHWTWILSPVLPSSFAAEYMTEPGTVVGVQRLGVQADGAETATVTSAFLE